MIYNIYFELDDLKSAYWLLATVMSPTFRNHLNVHDNICPKNLIYPI